MSPNTSNLTKRHQPSELHECFLDFILSRQAMLCTPRTIKFYRDTLGKFLEWLGKHDVFTPQEISSKHVRGFLATFAERSCSDSYIHTYARSAKTFFRFLHKENYISELVVFDMPRIGEMRLPVLSIDDVKEVLAICSNPRDRAIILLMVDTGLRRSEVCALNWGDIDLSNGICLVQKGKGKKARSVVLGILSRRALLTYRRNVVNHEDGDPLFQISSGSRLSPYGLRSVFVRLSEKAGVHVSAHALRRTFVVMSLKGGMSLAHVQALMGHKTPNMTLHYAKLVDDDLLNAHKEHGPVDNYLRN